MQCVTLDLSGEVVSGTLLDTTSGYDLFMGYVVDVLLLDELSPEGIVSFFLSVRQFLEAV